MILQFDLYVDPYNHNDYERLINKFHEVSPVPIDYYIKETIKHLNNNKDKTILTDRLISITVYSLSSCSLDDYVHIYLNSFFKEAILPLKYTRVDDVISFLQSYARYRTKPLLLPD